MQVYFRRFVCPLSGRCLEHENVSHVVLVWRTTNKRLMQNTIIHAWDPYELLFLTTLPEVGISNCGRFYLQVSGSGPKEPFGEGCGEQISVCSKWICIYPSNFIFLKLERVRWIDFVCKRWGHTVQKVRFAKRCVYCAPLQRVCYRTTLQRAQHVLKEKLMAQNSDIRCT